MTPKQVRALGRGMASRQFKGARALLYNLMISRPIKPDAKQPTPIITDNERKQLEFAMQHLDKMASLFDVTTRELRKEYMKNG